MGVGWVLKRGFRGGFGNFLFLVFSGCDWDWRWFGHSVLIPAFSYTYP